MSDERFAGEYNGKHQHEPDFDLVIKRANAFGVKKFLFAAGYIADAKISYDLAKRSNDFYATIGVHPCRALEPYKSAGLVFDDLTADQRQVALQNYLTELD